MYNFNLAESNSKYLSKDIQLLKIPVLCLSAYRMSAVLKKSKHSFRQTVKRHQTVKPNR